MLVGSLPQWARYNRHLLRSFVFEATGASAATADEALLPADAATRAAAAQGGWGAQFDRI
jgi:hypothetical protein